MAHPVILPRQGQSVESCIITQWHKKEGDAVAEGELLFSYETDKASFDEAAKVSGTLLAIFHPADDDVPVLSAVAAIGEVGEDISALQAGGEQPQAAQSAAPVVERKAPAPIQVKSPAAGVSPRARVTAQRLGIDPAAAAPTGPGGRIIERDIFAARDAALLPRETKPELTAPAAPVPAKSDSETEYTDTRLSTVRRTIARVMHESLSSMAQLTHHSSFDATHLLELRKRFKAAPAEKGLNDITINDLILFAVSRTLLRHPALNAHFLSDSIRVFRRVHLGIAVDTPRGLLVPTLFSADTKTLTQISRESKELAQAAASGNINPDSLTGGTFTVSNLGALGVESFTPIINPPQAAILGVDCAVERVRTVNGQISTYPAMGLSLTYDHRAVDGAPASRFLQDVCRTLEDIDLLLIAQGA